MKAVVRGMNVNKFSFPGIILIGLFLSMCAPIPESPASGGKQEYARIDSLRKVRCPRLMSSAAEYYKNRDWESTVRVYNEIVDLGCARNDPRGVYLYYAIAYEYMGKYDSSEVVLLKGLQVLPNNIDLRKRLAYAYQKQGKIEQQTMEYDRLSYLVPEDTEIKSELARLYGQQGRCEDQISVLKDLLNIDPDNEGAQGDLAQAYEDCGKDPLDIYADRYRKNPDNISYGLDYADRLVSAERPEEAAEVLKSITRKEPTSKVAWRKLIRANNLSGDLEATIDGGEELYKLDPRDHNVAIQLSEYLIEMERFEDAFRWADKAVTGSKSGGAYGQKGNVYYKAFQFCRGNDVTDKDRIIASLAFENFTRAEELGFTRYSNNKNWLKENEVLFGRAQWFMQDPSTKSRGYLTPDSPCYNWVKEKLIKDPKW